MNDSMVLPYLADWLVSLIHSYSRVTCTELRLGTEAAPAPGSTISFYFAYSAARGVYLEPNDSGCLQNPAEFMVSDSATHARQTGLLAWRSHEVPDDFLPTITSRYSNEVSADFS